MYSSRSLSARCLSHRSTAHAHARRTHSMRFNPSNTNCPPNGTAVFNPPPAATELSPKRNCSTKKHFFFSTLF